MLNCLMPEEERKKSFFMRLTHGSEHNKKPKLKFKQNCLANVVYNFLRGKWSGL